MFLKSTIINFYNLIINRQNLQPPQSPLIFCIYFDFHYKEIEKINREKFRKAQSEDKAIAKLKQELSNLISHSAQSELLEQALKESIEQKQQELNQLEINRHINQINRINASDVDLLKYDMLSTEAKKDVCRKMIEKILEKQ